MPAGRKVFIEIKCGAEILPELRRTLEHSGLSREQIVLIGFGYETMRAAKVMSPEVHVAWLVAVEKDTGEYPEVSGLIRRAQEAEFDGLDLNKGFPIDRAFVRTIHDAGLRLYTWTVDDAVTAREQMEAGVDGITTNRPGWLREQLGLR